MDRLVGIDAKLDRAQELLDGFNAKWQPWVVEERTLEVRSP
jgi:hypothetical protein